MNSTTTNAGHLGLGITLPTGQMFAAGTQELVRVTFSSSIIAPMVVALLGTSFVMGWQPSER